MRMIITILIQLLLSVALISQETKFVDVGGIEYMGKELVDSIRLEGLHEGIEYNTMVMLFTDNLKLNSSKFQDKFILFLLFKTHDSNDKIIIICDSVIYKDTLLNINCLFDKSWLKLCYDNYEMPYTLKDGFFLPNLPSNWSSSYFSLIFFEKDDTFFFEADISGHKIFNDKPDKKKKREEVAKTITECLVELLEKL